MAEPTDAQLQQYIAHVSRDASLALVLKHFHGFEGVALTDEQLRNHIDEAGRRDPSLHRVLSHYARHTDLTDEQLVEDINVAGRRLPSLHEALLNITTFSLAKPRNIYGRLNQAVPSGVTLPEGIGGELPHTYTATGLPSGITFTPGTRTLSGTPDTVSTGTATYTVTDAAGEVLQDTFDWQILDLLSSTAIRIQDFDGGKLGYGVSDFNPVFATTLISGANAGFSNVALWASAPRIVIGSVVDDPLAIRPLPAGGIMSRIEWRPQSNPDQFRIFDSNQDVQGNPVESHIGNWGLANPDLTLYLQRALGQPSVALAFDDDRQSGADWNITFNVTPAESTWIRANLNDNFQFIMVIA